MIEVVREGLPVETMNIALPSPMKAFVQEQVAEGGYSSASEYIRKLIREEQERRGRQELERKLLEALESGPATPWTPDDLAELKRRVRKRHPNVQDEA
jgi:antitoxin ParD1/3/4